MSTKSSTDSAKYPSDDIPDGSSYWYTYKGSDCIDPTSVTYSKNVASAGDTITVSVTKRSNTYGGTISYTYEYSTDFGATWTNASSKTITVPNGATNLIVRVKAKDNYGFTSSTYVYGNGISIK